MIRTLIFGAIAGYVGKKLYDEGKLTEFKNDLVGRYNDAKTKLDEQRADSGSTSTSPIVSSNTAPSVPLPH
ncbi:hypothetical protein [Sphingobium olei]|uniref:YtxH domain-containing protein n=1 Tax=Sphingobium olei TaxID=420955 RepID=A0ABW3P407_9SPHN